MLTCRPPPHSRPPHVQCAAPSPRVFLLASPLVGLGRRTRRCQLRLHVRTRLHLQPHRVRLRADRERGVRTRGGGGRRKGGHGMVQGRIGTSRNATCALVALTEANDTTGMRAL
eukprot:356673-Chlamydomonas_euryale.AAC.5